MESKNKRRRETAVNAHEGYKMAEEVAAEEMEDTFEVEGVVKEDVGEAEAGELREVPVKTNKVSEATELSLEAVIAEKEEEAGRELNVKEREYLSLQLEQQRILQISVSMRGDEDKKRYNAIRNQLEKLKHLQEFLKLPSKGCKSAAQRMKKYRGKMSNDTREDDRAKPCNQSSLEATLGQKEEEAGKELEDDEQEYVRLQFERNLLMCQYPNASDRQTKEAGEELDDIDAGECSGCRKGWTHVCPLDQSQSEAPEKPSQDRSKLSSSQVEDEYLRLRQENETFLKEHPVASQRSQEEKSRIQKIRDRMKKVRGQMSKGNPDTVRMTQSQGKGRSDRKEPTGKRSRRNDGNENPDEGHETKR